MELLPLASEQLGDGGDVVACIALAGQVEGVFGESKGRVVFEEAAEECCEVLGGRP